MVKHSKMLGLLEPEVEGTTIRRSSDSYLYPTTERNNPEDLNLTANPLSELLISRGHSFAKSSHVHFAAHKTVKQSNPITGLDRPRGFQGVKVPRFVTTAQDGGKVVSLTHRPPLPPANTPGTHFC